jgi:hypothetical protein
MDDERLHHMQFRATTVSGGMEPAANDLQPLIEQEAERIERTVGCVTTVNRQDNHNFEPSDIVVITLVAILPRHVDMELFSRAAEAARYRIMTAAHEES